MCDATHKKSFGLGLTAINEVHRRIYYILDNILFSSTDVYQTCVLKFEQGTKILHNKENVHDMKIFQDLVIVQDTEGLL